MKESKPGKHDGGGGFVFMALTISLVFILLLVVAGLYGCFR